MALPLYWLFILGAFINFSVAGDVIPNTNARSNSSPPQTLTSQVPAVVAQQSPVTSFPSILFIHFVHTEVRSLYVHQMILITLHVVQGYHIHVHSFRDGSAYTFSPITCTLRHCIPSLSTDGISLGLGKVMQGQGYINDMLRISPLTPKPPLRVRCIVLEETEEIVTTLSKEVHMLVSVEREERGESEELCFVNLNERRELC